MSGTSLDGLDLVSCIFSESNNKWNYLIGQATTIPYDEDMNNLLNSAPGVSAIELLKMDRRYAEYIAQQINQFTRNTNFKADLIASHGHTIFHQPEIGITYQLGDGATIAEKTGITTVSDFRAFDIVHGGQGAPLVPVGDMLLFGKYDACLNLGGFSNISFTKDQKRIAFDICPVNIIINLLAQKAGSKMDLNGKIAESGNMVREILLNLNKIEFYSQPFPKSLGREWLEENVIPLVINDRIKISDALRTVYEHIAIQISGIINDQGLRTVLVTGGGAFNKFLIQLIGSKSKADIFIPDELLVNYKEALIFGLLGVLRIRNEINCLASVTGARTDLSTGVIYLIKK